MAATAHRPTPRAVVVGLGQTGLSCVRYLRARGYAVTAVDSRAEPPQAGVLATSYPDVQLYRGGFDPRAFADTQLVVVSPGVSIRERPIADAAARGAEIVGDVELFARAVQAPVIAITGSNGKSTVTTLVGAICKAAGMNAVVAGNIGVPVLDTLADQAADVYVLELSSFQLETTVSLNARAATVLNLTPDHMDRYRDVDDYAQAKARIFRGDGIAVVNRDDAIVCAMATPERRAISFGLDAPPTPADFGVLAHGGQDWLAQGARLLMPTDDIPIPGRHNVANVLAAMALAHSFDIPIEPMTRAVRSFRGLPHRTELVAEADGVRWYNDSKGTNVGATVAALNGMTSRVILIAGGDGKGADFTPLRPAVAAHARAVVLIGRDAPQIERALAGAVPLAHARDMDAAVRAAQELAQPGDVVLLSPACASFDMFRNYEHRGAVFTQAVNALLALADPQ